MDLMPRATDCLERDFGDQVERGTVGTAVAETHGSSTDWTGADCIVLARMGRIRDVIGMVWDTRHSRSTGLRKPSPHPDACGSYTNRHDHLPVGVAAAAPNKRRKQRPRLRRVYS